MANDPNDHDCETNAALDRLLEGVERRLSSRRRFLAGTAAAGVGAVGMGGLAGASGDEDQARDPGVSTDESGTDVDVLNYALTLEHLEDAFYEEFLNEFSQETFVDSDALENFNAWEKRAAYGFVQRAGDHESTHVEVLTGVVETLGGEPASRRSYDFGVDSVGGYLQVAQALENTGVMAYDGAIALMESPDLTTAGATIATVEARHAAFLNYLNGDVPFPAAFDDTKSPEEILEIAGQFIRSGSDDGDGDSDSGD